MSELRMDPEKKSEWLLDLRSGDYEQGHNQLASKPYGGNPKHCCLGVLCETGVRLGIVERVMHDQYDSEHDSEGTEFEAGTQYYRAVGDTEIAWAYPTDAIYKAFGLWDNERNEPIVLVSKANYPEKLELQDTNRPYATLPQLNDVSMWDEDEEKYAKPYNFKVIADIIERFL